MTMVDDRPSTAELDVQRTGTPRTWTAPTASWRFASRLARREVRRRPGRTLLVMLLVLIPVLGMTVGSVLYRTTTQSDEVRAAREYGSADLLLFVDSATEALEDPEGGVFGPDTPTLPVGSQVAAYVETWTPVSAQVDGAVVTRSLKFSDADLSNSVIASTVELRAGRIPSGDGEVLFSSGIADRFGVEIGERIRFVRPELELIVVGIGRDADSWNNDLMVVSGFDRSMLRGDGYTRVETLVDLPDTASSQEIATLQDEFSSAGVTAIRPNQWFDYGESSTQRELAWGWVAGVVAMVAVGIVIAAAFATSARRQLVTIGQLSANGAPERLIRRTMGLQGMWTGILGAALGIVTAIAGLVVAHRTGLIDRISNHRVPGLEIVPFDMIVIFLTATVAATIAALIPARSAARIPVLSALAGRRPVSTPPSWMAPVGVVAFLVGLFLLGGAASIGTDGGGGGDFPAMLAVVGSMCVLAGIVCASPLIVAAVGSVGSRAGGVIRLASRSLGRSRTRSAAVLTAIATVGALATVGATVAPQATDDDGYTPDLRQVTLNYQWGSNPPFDESGDPISEGIVDEPPVVAGDVPISLRQGIEQVLPDATWVPITQMQIDQRPYVVSTGSEIPREGFDPDVAVLDWVQVAEGALLDRLNLNDEQQAVLVEEGVLALVPYWDRAVIPGPDGPIPVSFDSSLGALGFDGLPDTPAENERAQQLENDLGAVGWVVMTPEFASANGIATDVYNFQITNPTELTDAERDALNDLQPGYYGDDAFAPEATAAGFESLGGSSENSWYVNTPWQGIKTPEGLIQLGVVVASLLLVLGVVAIGLSLAAAESRDERDVLHAVGAAPKTLRRVAAAKAWVLTTGAGIVAVPAGYITILVITRATDSRAPFPFVVAAALLVVIPLTAAAATMTVSAAAQRFRPTTYSDLTVD